MRSTGVGDAAHRRAEIRQVDQGQQQSRNPEDMHVGEKRNQAEDGDDLELQLLRFVRHALGQAVQFPVQGAHPQEGRHKEKAHHHHQGVRPVGTGNEKRQMMGGCQMHLFAQSSSSRQKPEGPAVAPYRVRMMLSQCLI
jgi:hypothetical protein